jgi:photosystem II stability/assembly factor-like uncharacterized protein
MRSWFLLVALAVLAVVPDSAQNRPGDFHIVGAGGGGAMFHPTISPHDTNTVLVNCDMTGAYVTHDGGKSWRMFNLRGVVQFFAFDPKLPQRIYAYATGLWRSDDNGETWNLIYPQPATITGVFMASDHADEELMSSDPAQSAMMTAMAIDPENSKALYAATWNRVMGIASLLVSNDGGASWTKTGDLTGPAVRVWVDPHSPAGDRTLILAGTHSVEIKNSSGIHKVDGPPAKALTAVSAGFGADGKSIIYTIADDSAFVSDDQGAHWQKISIGAGGGKVRAIATSLRNPATAYVSYRDYLQDGVKYMGVAKTSDSGRTWQLVWKEDSNKAGKPGANIRDAWITPRFGSDWGENPLDLGVADQDPNLAYGTDLGRTMRTADGGATWAAVYSHRSRDESWTTTGLDVTTSYGYHFDPFDHNRQFISTTDIGLFRSEDRGKSWMSSTKGVPREWTNTTYWVEFDPKVRGRMWSVNSWTHDLPRPKMWRHGGVEKYRGGVCISNDGGKTWAKSNNGMEPTAATHILLDPTSSVDARVLYVAGFGRGVYKTVDGGKTWELKNAGITQEQPFAWRIVRDSRGTLYVLIARRSEKGVSGTSGDGALYKSTDGAEHWVPVALPKASNAPNGLAIDPEDPQRLYLALWAVDKGQHGEGGGIYLSENGGKDWRPILDRDQHVYDVTIDPRDPQILYAAGFESSVWRSIDRGERWTRVPGYNFKWGHRVNPDPDDPKKIYVTTFGGGVWYGSVDGQDRAIDIATPELQPGK